MCISISTKIYKLDSGKPITGWVYMTDAAHAHKKIVRLYVLVLILYVASVREENSQKCLWYPLLLLSSDELMMQVWKSFS